MNAVASDYQDIDKGYQAFVRRMKKYAKGPHVMVGVQSNDAERGGQGSAFGDSNVRLAAVHEFGSRDGRIPQRSFIRASIDRERQLLERMMDRAVLAIAKDGNAAKHLGLIGERARAEMVRTIDQSIGLAPLTPAGIRSKQVPSTTPLIDTGQLKGSITWKVYNV